MKFNKETEQKKDNQIDYSQPIPGSKCEKCNRPYKFFIPRPPVRPHYYCMEHLPENKKDWRYEMLREAYLKNEQFMANINSEYETLSPYEKYRATIQAHGGKLNKGI